ncbi:MAG: glycosyltransferase [Pseudomonadales bacterium]|nr:glycosyltransferase [Pseudomonadales bacterium]
MVVSVNESEQVLISIVTVVYNGEKYIEDTIKSILNQTYKNVEYIIIDGGSTDNTLNILKKYEKEISCVVSETDDGIYDAMNKGVARCNGSLIGIINADDYYVEGAFDLIIKAFSKSKEKTKLVIYGDMNLVNQDDRSVIRTKNAVAWKMIFGMSLNHPSVFVTRDIYANHSFSTDYKMASDYNLLLTLYLYRYKFIKIKYILTEMRAGGVSELMSRTTKAEEKAVKLDKLGRICYFFSEFILKIKKSMK